MMCTIYIYIIIASVMRLCQCVEVSRPRGVALTKIVFYNPDTNFTCLDGTQTLPFTYVNDDFCDCLDGSDEPGTAACPNGIFHCTNAGHKPINIPSSRVNDGVCDCCDATDEYGSATKCVNNCRDMGRKARDEAVRMAEIVTKGHQLKLDLSAEGKQRRNERKTRLDELQQLKEAADAIKAEKEDVKKSAEDLEQAALDKYKSEEEEKKKLEEEQQSREKNRVEAQDAFLKLDQNQDGQITVDEIQAKWVFDSNKDGVVSDEEAQFFLNNRDAMDEEAFVSLGWILMKPHYSMLNLFKGPEETDDADAAATPEDEDQLQEDSTVVTPDLQTEFPDEEGDSEGDDDEDGDDVEESAKFPETKEEEGADTFADTEPTPSPYDEHTQKLIDVANEARKAFDEANKQVGDLEREISDLKHILELDFGEDDQFSPLHGQCYEYTDREYTYKLCPFDQTSQRPKSGGSDINLGRWKGWDGPDEDRHSRMKYDHGLTCWNGPARSTEVSLSCGTDNKVVSVSEPSKCTYLFEFETPAICKLLSGNGAEHQHEEL